MTTDRQRRTSDESGPTPSRSTPKRRRRHAAAGARILAGGLSAAGALTLTATMAGDTSPNPAAQDPAAAPAVIVVRSADGTVDPAAAPQVSTPAAPPVTASRAS